MASSIHNIGKILKSYSATSSFKCWVHCSSNCLVKNLSDNQGKYMFFSFELKEKVLKNNKNLGKTQRKVKYKTGLNPGNGKVIKI